MTSPHPTTRDEPGRLTTLASYEPWPPGRWPALDALCAAAANVVGAPLGLVNMVEADALLTLAEVGAAPGRTPRGPSFCRHVVAQRRRVVVPDTLQDPHLRDSPYVVGTPHVRFYAGFPLRTATDEVLGTLCVMGPDPQQPTDDQLELLGVLADQAMAQLELHRQLALQQQASLAQQEALDRLRASERRYRLLAHNASDIVSRHDADGTVLWVSPSVTRVLGHDAEAELGTSPARHTHPDDLPLFAEALAGLSRQVLPQTVVGRARHADGSWRWLETTLSGAFDDDGALVEVHSTARDVTARCEAAASSAAAEQRYRALVEQTPDAILVHDGATILFANASAVTLLHAPSLEALLRMPLLDLVGPEEAGPVRGRIRDLLDGRRVPDMRRRLRRLDGSLVTVDVTDSRVDLPGGPGVQAVLRDATAAEAAEALLHESREQDRTLFEQSPVPLVQTDGQGCLLRVNAALAQLIGRPPQDLIGRPLRELAEGHPTEGLASQAAAGDDHPVVDRTFLRPDGTRVETTNSATVLRDDDGSVRSLVVTVVDMTERNHARRALETLVDELR